MADAAQYIPDIEKYTSPVNADAVAAIVKHLGIALQGNDSSLVSCSDKSELERVRESWCKRKLALADADADLDSAIGAVCEAMKDTSRKGRVTFYYLLAERYGKLADL